MRLAKQSRGFWKTGGGVKLDKQNLSEEDSERERERKRGEREANELRRGPNSRRQKLGDNSMPLVTTVEGLYIRKECLCEGRGMSNFKERNVNGGRTIACLVLGIRKVTMIMVMRILFDGKRIMS
jgi:hypothetical protein